MIVLTRPDEQDREKNVRKKKGKKTTFKREDKSWRANQKPEHDTQDEMEELMLKFNQQFKCKKCQGISSIYAPECTLCGEPNPYPATQTH